VRAAGLRSFVTPVSKDRSIDGSSESAARRPSMANCRCPVFTAGYETEADSDNHGRALRSHRSIQPSPGRRGRPGRRTTARYRPNSASCASAELLNCREGSTLSVGLQESPDGLPFSKRPRRNSSTSVFVSISARCSWSRSTRHQSLVISSETLGSIHICQCGGASAQPAAINSSRLAVAAAASSTELR
jgi:hypothetical protein